MSITITTIKNPFEPEFNEIQVVDHVPGQTLGGYLPNLPVRDGVNFVFSVNGQTSLPGIVINDGDIVGVCAKTEISAFASWVAGSLLGLSSGTFAYGAAYVFVSAATFMAVGYGMSALVSALGPDVPEQSTENSQEFGWGSLAPYRYEGSKIPLIFGTVRTAGQVLQQYVCMRREHDDGTWLGDREYLYALMGVCDHALDGLSDFRINDQSYDKYENVSVTYRLGESTESLPGFSEISKQTVVDALMTRLTEETDVPIERTTSGDSVQKIMVHVCCPGGMYNMEGGGFEIAPVSYSVFYRVTGTTEWTGASAYPDTEEWDGGELIGGKFEYATPKAVRAVVVLDDLSPNQYDIRVLRRDVPANQVGCVDDIYFESFTEIIKEDLLYPGMTLYAVSAMATDQLSGGFPNLSCEAERETVSVYDPDTETWVDKPANSPAWICYALLVHYADISTDQIVFDEFDTWANYCYETVNGSNRFQCSTIITEGNFWDNIQRIARIGHGVVIHRGSKYGVFIDMPETTVSHMFTMGSILDGTFNLQYLPQKDRANYIELEYTDPDKDFTRQVIGIYDPAYLSSNTDQKASVSFDAVIPYDQVVREGVFRINSNRYLNRVVSFDADIYSFACRVGDLFYFQHEIVDYETANTGGRIVAAGNDDGDGNPFIQLDQDVTIESDLVFYKILVEFENGTFVERTVTTAPGDPTDTLTLSQPWVAVPEKFNQYMFGNADTYLKKYRLTSCEFRDDYTRTIVGIEYDERVYSDDSFVVVDDVERTDWENVTPEAVSVKAYEFLAYSKDGTIRSSVSVSWVPSFSKAEVKWAVWIEDVTGETLPEKIFTVSGTSTTIESYSFVTGRSYKIYVTPDGNGFEDTLDNSATITIQGKLAPPADVTGFDGIWSSMHRTITFTWDAVSDIDLHKYEIRQGADWDTGTKIVESIDTSAAIQIAEGVSEDRTYLIKAVDTSGIYSENEGSKTLTINTGSTDVSSPSGLALTSESVIAEDGTDRVYLRATWNSITNVNFHHFEILLEEKAIGKFSEYSTSRADYQWEVLPNTLYGVSVAAVEISGNRTAYCAQVTITTSKDTTAPSMSGKTLTAQGTYTSIILSWDHGAERDLDHFEVYRNTSNTSSSAGKVGNAVKDFSGVLAMFNDTPPTNGTYYYWVKPVDTSGNIGDFSNSASASAPGVSATVGPGSITATEIADDAITTPKIYAGAVGTNELAANAVTAIKINVSTLSAISANIGTITAGRLQNSANTTYLDLTNGLMSLGGKLTWNGTDLSIGYSNISGGPPSDADKTQTVLSAGADISATKIGTTTLISSDKIRTSLLAADVLIVGGNAGDLAQLDTVSDSYITSIAGGKISTGIITSTSGNLKFDLNNNILDMTNDSALIRFGSNSDIMINGSTTNIKMEYGSTGVYNYLKTSTTGFKAYAMASMNSCSIEGDGYDIDLDSSAYNINLDAGGVISLKASGYTFYHDGYSFRPGVTGTNYWLGTDTCNWHSIYAYRYLTASGWIYDTEDDLTILANVLPKKDLDGAAKICPNNGKELLSVASLPDYLTNKEELRAVVKSENGDLISDDDFEEYILDDDELGWRLMRDIAGFVDLTSGAVRQLNDEITLDMYEQFNSLIEDLTARITSLETSAIKEIV